jgi:hypothetical protein
MAILRGIRIDGDSKIIPDDHASDFRIGETVAASQRGNPSIGGRTKFNAA